MENIKKVAFACDAGMGSSAFGAATFKKKLQKENIPEDSDVIVVHKNLVGRTEMSHKGKKIIAITNYLNDPNIEELLENIKESRKK